MTVRRTLFKGGTILTLDASVPDLVCGDVLIEDDRIAAVGKTFPPTMRR